MPDRSPIAADRAGRKGIPTLIHALGDAVQHCPEQTAMVCDGTQASYQEFGQAVARIAAKVESLGLGKGDRVGIAVGQSVELLQLIYGVMASGAQATMFNPMYTAREYEPLLEISQPKLIFCDAVSNGAIKSASKERQITLLDLSTGPEIWLEPGTPDFPPNLPQPEDMAMLLFTGGTTGRPKAVPHTHGAIRASVEISDGRWHTNLDQEVFLTIPPLFHIAGLMMGCFWPVYCRSKVVLLPRFHPELVFDAIIQHAPTIFAAGIPTVYTALLHHAEFDNQDFSGLRFTTGGGAPLPAAMLREWEERTGVIVLEGYGMSEGVPFCDNPLKGVRKPGSVGLPVAGTEVEIVDVETGQKVMPVGETGEIRVKGAQVATGYINDPEATTTAFRDGWLYTGDIAYQDEDGYYFIVDRVKDMAIVSGYNVYPREIDELLAAHPAISEAAAVGVPDDYRGEIVRAYVVVKEDQELTAEQLLDYCRENLVHYKVPGEVVITTDLPKTPVGKIDKKQLRIK